MTPKNPEYQTIPIKSLSLSDTNPRNSFDDKSIVDLAASIKAHGILQPLLARPHPKKKDVFEIISGARRYKGAIMAKLKEVPCRIKTGLTDEEVRAIQLVENLQRQDVLPLDEAEGIAELLKCKGFDLALIAQQIGKDESYVAKRLKLLELVPEAKKFLKSGLLTQEHVNLLARLTPVEQRDTLQRCARQWDDLMDVASPGKMRLDIEQHYFLDLSRAPWDKADAKLLPKAGACTACPKMTGNSRNLFDDVKKGDTCTDPVCFEQKFTAFVQIKAADSKMKVYKIMDRYNSEKNGVLGTQDWEPAPKRSCENIAIGIFVNGEKLGKELSICVRESLCKTHYGATARQQSTETAAQKEKRVKQEKERKEEIQLRRAVIQGIEQSAPEKLDVEDFRVIALALWHGCRRDEQTKLLKLRGWMPEKKEKGEYFDPDAHGADLIAKAEYDLHRFCMYMSVARFIEEAPTSFDYKSDKRTALPDPLMLLAKKYAVDVDGIANDSKAKPKAAGK